MITNIVQTKKSIESLQEVISQIEDEWDVSFEKTILVNKNDVPFARLESEESSDITNIAIACTDKFKFLIIFEAK